MDWNSLMESRLLGLQKDSPVKLILISVRFVQSAEANKTPMRDSGASKSLFAREPLCPQIPRIFSADFTHTPQQ
jgi:hypothetical protein